MFFLIKPPIYHAYDLPDAVKQGSTTTYFTMYVYYIGLAEPNQFSKYFFYMKESNRIFSILFASK